MARKNLQRIRRHRIRERPLQRDRPRPSRDNAPIRFPSAPTGDILQAIVDGTYSTGANQGSETNAGFWFPLPTSVLAALAVAALASSEAGCIYQKDGPELQTQQKIEAVLPDNKYKSGTAVTGDSDSLDDKTKTPVPKGPDPEHKLTGNNAPVDETGPVSREKLDTLLKRFGYDPADDAQFKKRYLRANDVILSEQEIEVLRKREHYKGLEILADLWEMLPEMKPGERRSELYVKAQQREIIKKFDNGDVFLEAISKLSDYHMGKIKKLFSYVEFRKDDHERLLNNIGHIAIHLGEPLQPEVLKQRYLDGALKRFRDDRTGKIKKPTLDDYSWIDQEWERAKRQHQIAQRNFKLFTSDRAFELYKLYKQLGINVFSDGFIGKLNRVASIYNILNKDGVKRTAYDEFIEEYGFKARVTPELTEKVKYFKDNFKRHELKGKDIDCVDAVSLDFLKFLKENMGITRISDGDEGDMDIGVVTYSATSLDLTLLPELEANRAFLEYLDTAVIGSHSGIRDRLYGGGRLKGDLGQEVVDFLLTIARGGGKKYIEAYKARFNVRELHADELYIIKALSEHDGNAFIRALAKNSITGLSVVERASLPGIAANKQLRDFVTGNKTARYLVFDEKTVEWVVNNLDNIDSGVLKRVYRDAGKVSRYDMPLVSALSQDKELLRLYRNRKELESFARKIYEEDPVIRTKYGWGRGTAEERPDISSLSSLDLLKLKIVYEALRSEEAKKFIGNLVWKDINEYKAGGKKFTSELCFSAYYENGKLVFVAEEPSSHREIRVNTSMFMNLPARNEECLQPPAVERNGYYPLIRGHLHATSEDDSQYAGPSGLNLAQTLGVFSSDIVSPFADFTSELVITTLGLDSDTSIKVGADYYRLPAKGRDRQVFSVDIGKTTVPYEKAEPAEKK